MMKFNWDKFKSENVAVHCDTEEKAREFVKECHKRSMEWRVADGNKAKWGYGKNTHYCYNHENSGYLEFGDKATFEGFSYKIIKWESEEDMKFKVGDKVVKADGSEWSNGGEYKTITECCKFNGVSRYELSDNDLYWFDYEIELYKEPQTEFTFQEIIARIKPGEVYISTKGFKFEAKIDLVDEGLRIRYFKDGVKISRRNGGIVFTHQNRWVLQEPKEHVTIYKVEHQKDSKQYDFVSSQLLEEGQFVVCDTKHGKSYGRIVDIESRELTEEEIKQYKECWRI